MQWHHFAIRLGLALMLGSFIGAERQWRHRTAGLRTHALVAAGASMFVMLSALTAGTVDSSFRIAGQVVSGIGFLGAGVILRHGASVTGLNTARRCGVRPRSVRWRVTGCTIRPSSAP
jgi:putative Mg2+ transporter-C (MgtC) family protein